MSSIAAMKRVNVAANIAFPQAGVVFRQQVRIMLAAEHAGQPAGRDALHAGGNLWALPP